MLKLGVEALKKMKESLKADLSLRVGDRPAGPERMHVMICGGTGCHASGSLRVKEALLKELDQNGLSREIRVVETG